MKTARYHVGIVIPGSRTFFSIPNLRIGKSQIPGLKKLYFSFFIFHDICYKLEKMTSLVTYWQWHSSVLLQLYCKLQLLSSIPSRPLQLSGTNMRQPLTDI